MKGCPVTKSLSVSAIENGTVIDHILAGQALRIVRLLSLAASKHKVTLGLNLTSCSMRIKDIIKIEHREITIPEANQIAIFAPNATINIIQNYQLVKKFRVQLPQYIQKCLTCPNPRCISNSDPMETHFYVNGHGENVELYCKYCEKSFSHDTY
jgi:aspartate carbamoyltransferase regulatory subunit